MNSFGVIVTAIAVVASMGCAAVAVAVGRPPRSRTYVAQAAVLGVLVALAPIALVVFMRLSRKMCVVMNVLGLPWAEPWREIAHWGAGLIWLAATVMLIVALAQPTLRRAGVAMLIWSVVSVIPAFILYFVMTYGDPAAGCVPV